MLLSGVLLVCDLTHHVITPSSSIINNDIHVINYIYINNKITKLTCQYYRNILTRGLNSSKYTIIHLLLRQILKSDPFLLICI